MGIFPAELTTDFFVLATHLNNLATNGTVVVENQNIEYFAKKDILVPLLYKGELHSELLRHHSTSKLIYWAFQKLIEESKAPIEIIDDLLKKIKEEEKEQAKK